MATTYNEGTKLENELSANELTKAELFGRFTKELKPVIEELNELLHKYEIVSIESFIKFPIEKSCVTPMINYELFPASISASKLSK